MGQPSFAFPNQEVRMNTVEIRLAGQYINSADGQWRDDAAKWQDATTHNYDKLREVVSVRNRRHDWRNNRVEARILQAGDPQRVTDFQEIVRLRRAKVTIEHEPEPDSIAGYVVNNITVGGSTGPFPTMREATAWAKDHVAPRGHGYQVSPLAVP